MARITRRRLLQGAGAAAAAHVVLPAVGRFGPAFGATGAGPAAAHRNRLVVIHLYGGNDGLNTVVPTTGTAYDVYRKVRPSLAYAPSKTLRFDDHFGLNAKLKTMDRLHRAGRMAVVQGVDYPDHSYSHFTSGDIWHSGEPGRAPDSGWLGRHLDRAGIPSGQMRGVGLGYELPLMLRGERRSGVEIASIAATRFGDGVGAVADPRHRALALFGHHPHGEPLREYVGRGAKQAADLVDVLASVPPAKTTGSNLGDTLLTVRTLLGLDIGTECVFVGAGGYDTHTGQQSAHEDLLADLDASLEAFFLGTFRGKSLGIGALPAALASRTMVMVMSEFGRRIGENGSGEGAGTDHGAAAPVLFFGPAGKSATGRRLVPGMHGELPSLGTTKMPADNLDMTLDVRRVYQAVLTHWLDDPDPMYDRAGPLRGLFA